MHAMFCQGLGCKNAGLQYMTSVSWQNTIVSMIHHEWE